MSCIVKPPVAVVGYGTITASGKDTATALRCLRDGRVNNTLLSTPYFPEGFAAPCFVVDDAGLINLDGLIDVADRTRSINRTLHLALTAIFEAVHSAGMSISDLSGQRVGIALGTTVGCTFHNEEYYIDWKNGDTPDPQLLQRYFISNLADRIQHILKVTGPKTVITNACASGTDAIGIAKAWLEQDMCDIAIAGGVDEISKMACNGFKSLMLVSEESCAPFDVNRKGLNLGEGAGIMLLQKEESTQNKPLGWIRGYGIGGDGYHPTAPHPEGKGLQLAVSKALLEAGIRIDQIAMVNAHGTGTKANDKAETTALMKIGAPVDLPVVSTKGATGHTLGAAGGVEAVFSLAALNTGEVAGTIGCKHCDPELEFKPLLQGDLKQFPGKIGLSQSLAFGGGNSALVIEGAVR